jgi:hypothetical protein
MSLFSCAEFSRHELLLARGAALAEAGLAVTGATFGHCLSIVGECH